MQQYSIQDSDVVKHLIIINVIAFVTTTFTPLSKFLYSFTLYYVDAPQYHFYQFFTHMFLHGSIMHVFFNMYALFLFGKILERIWGAQRFLFFYFATGFGAALIYLLAEGINFYFDYGTFLPYSESLLYTAVPVLGASGAVTGLVAAFAVLFPNTELMLLFIPVPIKAKYLVGAYLAYELVSGVISLSGPGIEAGGGGIAHFAHLGGALIGFIIIKLWQGNKENFY